MLYVHSTMRTKDMLYVHSTMRAKDMLYVHSTMRAKDMLQQIQNAWTPQTLLHLDENIHKTNQEKN